MTTLEYRTTADGLTPEQLNGEFFVGWVDPPSPETLLRILQGSDHVVIAVRDEKVIGFVTAISDGVLSAFITLLEVVPEDHDKGIGHSLINQMLEEIGPIYMVDLVCNANLSRFYAELGFATTTGMSRRDYSKQSGR
ncbi:MAG TPA: GNAT family N-acetyltransferase [Acidimicrobiia bacterium]|jgi:ribosomal protein S18 acetylase RimI-like enzyme|nr:GNAT family N-acetyltransferase [Acidimicrobiia bacterium]